mgnify:FL=1
MPHFVIEYSRNIESDYDVNEIIDTAFQAGVDCGFMNPDSIQVRAIGYDNFRLKDGLTSFLHLTVALFAGRTLEQKQSFTTLACERLAERFPKIVSISVDMRDMDQQVYRKRLAGS